MRINVPDMIRHFKSKGMEKSEVCGELENMGVVMDRQVWENVAEAYNVQSQSQPELSSVKEPHSELKVFHIHQIFQNLFKLRIWNSSNNKLKICNCTVNLSKSLSFEG